MYGIPNMKLEKHIIDRKVKLMKEEGIEFFTLHNPLKYEGDERGRVKRMLLQKMELE